MEGRWLHNKSYIDDYLTFWFRRGGAPRRYTSWFAWAAWQRHAVVDDAPFITSVLPDLLTNLRQWTASHLGDYGGERVCWWQNDGVDAMEVSISGNGCRPTINSVMFGEAAALLEIAHVASNRSVVSELTTVRERARRVVLDQLWSDEITSFANIPLPWPAPSPPAPPAPLPPGFSPFNSGTFCCDQAPCVGGHSRFVFAGSLSAAACFAKCTADFAGRCHYVTTHANTFCQLSQFCNATNPWAGQPALTTTYRRGGDGTTSQRGDSGDGGNGGDDGDGGNGVDGGGGEAAAAALPPSHSSSSSSAPPASRDARAGCPGNGTHAWAVNETVSVRELLGFMPWYYSLPNSPEAQLIPAADAARYLPMWRQLFDADGFAAPWGLRTAERRSPCYNFSWAHHDCWNGPSWPYETARVLTSAANVLNEYPSQSVLTPAEYTDLLVQYARQHTRTTAVNDTATPRGSGHVFELVHPDLGYWIDRFRLYLEGSSMRNMGDDYNHSTFIDLVLTGLFGFRPRPDKHLVLNPLVPPGLLTHFAVDHVLYHGHMLAIVWDEDGSHYGVGAGLRLLVDGKVVASSPTMTKLSASLP